VAACVAGGVAAGWADDRTGGGPRLVRFDAHPELAPVACVPPTRLSTEAARGLLPATVPFADAARNAARAALLVPALTTRPELLFDATEDHLHQAYRAPAMPGSSELMTRLRRAGVPAVISGAGPTVLAFGNRSAIDSVAAETGMDWTIQPLDVDSDGACALPSEPR
jgi:homoserine kinase